MGDDNRGDAFIRWQGIAITQMTYAVNLVLGFSVAALGFAVSLLLRSDFVPVSGQKCAFAVGIFSLLVSVALGLWCVINRLRDFRETASIARQVQQGGSDSNIGQLRARSESMGILTWRLLWWQIVSFAIAVLTIVIGVSGAIASKLL